MGRKAWAMGRSCRPAEGLSVGFAKFGPQGLQWPDGGTFPPPVSTETLVQTPRPTEDGRDAYVKSAQPATTATRIAPTANGAMNRMNTNQTP